MRFHRTLILNHNQQSSISKTNEDWFDWTIIRGLVSESNVNSELILGIISYVIKIWQSNMIE
jgi:hypothetical protein